MRTLVRIATASATALGLLPLAVQACVCPALSIAEAFRKADHVFVAEIHQKEVTKGTTLAVDTVVAKFAALETFKGRPAQLTAIHSTTAAGLCGIGKLLLESKRIVVFTRDNGWVGSCDGTRAYNPTDIEALRQLQISMRPNTALLTDTYTSPLHARHGAAERER